MVAILAIGDKQPRRLLFINSHGKNKRLDSIRKMEIAFVSLLLRGDQFQVKGLCQGQLRMFFFVDFSGMYHPGKIHLRGKPPAKATFARKIIRQQSTCVENHSRKLPLRGRSSVNNPFAGQTNYPSLNRHHPGYYYHDIYYRLKTSS